MTIQYEEVFMEKMNTIGTLMNNVTIFVLDLETTGLSPMNHEITEIGITVLNPKKSYKLIDLNKGNEFNRLIKINGDVPPKITEITGITNEMLANEKPLKEVMMEMGQFIRDNANSRHICFLCQNAKFDIGFITKAMIDTGIIIPMSYILDTMNISKMLYPGEKRHNLQALCERFEVEYDSDSHHRAVYDTQITADVFINQMKQLLEFNPMQLLKSSIYANPNINITQAQLSYIKGLCGEEIFNNQIQYILNELNIGLIIELFKLIQQKEEDESF